MFFSKKCESSITDLVYILQMLEFWEWKKPVVLKGKPGKDFFCGRFHSSMVHKKTLYVFGGRMQGKSYSDSLFEYDMGMFLLFLGL